MEEPDTVYVGLSESAYGLLNSGTQLVQFTVNKVQVLAHDQGIHRPYHILHVLVHFPLL
jgi:hypothetical protein